jgi:Peptidase A4 family
MRIMGCPQTRDAFSFLSCLMAVTFLASAGSQAAAASPGNSTPTPRALGAYTGYQVAGNFTELRVRGSWIVPAANCAITPNSVSNISVIIDGIGGEGDAMEVGTYQDCTSGVATYGAFVNIYPTASPTRQLSRVAVHPGDVIEAQGTWRCIVAKCIKDGLCLCWHSNFIDETTGVVKDVNGYTPTTYAPVLDSAALVLSSDGHPLTSLGTVYTGYLYTGVSRSDVAGNWRGHSTFGETGALSGYTLVSLTAPGTSLSQLSQDGSSFTMGVSS